MRISELARATGVPLATIKYYLRESLLPAGRATAATQAEYDSRHVERLRLIRALVDVGRLPLSRVRELVAALDDAVPDVAAAVATAHAGLPPVTDPDGDPARARALTDRLGWAVDPDSAALHQLEAALRALDETGLAPDQAKLDVYADAARQVAEADIATTPQAGVHGASAADVVRTVVVGTVLYEPLLLALRRLAQQDAFVTRR